MGNNHLTLAVAGSRKTQGLVEHCKTLPEGRNVLLVTFTQTNQHELRKRVAQEVGDVHSLEVTGWFTLLLRHFVKPFIPFLFPGERCKGFNYEGRPQRYAKEYDRFFDNEGKAYGCELSRLAYELITASEGALMYRLECLFDEILIDEVQDLSGYDWDILESLFRSKIQVHLVGDIRQAVLSTNSRTAKNRNYAYSKSVEWFRKHEKRKLLTISYRSITWRCRIEIARFSDTIFDASWGFPPTDSENNFETDHDGVFLLRTQDVPAYVGRFSPQCLRDSIRSGKELDLPYMNFGVAKGQTYERVLIYPTGPIGQFVAKGIELAPTSAADFYVAVTRAKQSVAIILDKPGTSSLPYWAP